MEQKHNKQIKACLHISHIVAFVQKKKIEMEDTKSFVVCSLEEKWRIKQFRRCTEDLTVKTFPLDLKKKNSLAVVNNRMNPCDISGCSFEIKIIKTD